MEGDIICKGQYEGKFINTELRIKAESLVKSTGYSINELSRVEYAFEIADKGANKEDWMFNGLVAVLEVLDEIHEVNTTLSEEIKEKFTNHHNTKLVLA